MSFNIPHHDGRGVRDDSYTNYVFDRLRNPQLIPLFLLPATKGPVGKLKIHSNLITHYFGEEIYQKGNTFYTHISRNMQKLTGTFIIKRFVPNNAQMASRTFFADIITDNIENYKRDADARFIIPLETDPTIPTIAGYSVKFIVEDGISTEEKEGCREINGVKSVMIPMFSLFGGYGKYYNNLGISLSSPELRNDDMEKSLTYVFSMFNSKGVMENLTGIKESHVSFQQEAVDSYNIERDLAKVTEKYFNSNLENGPIVPEEMGIQVYHSNILKLSKMILNTELAFVNEDTIEQYDFETVATAQDYPLLIDIISLKSQNRKVPYRTVCLDRDNIIIPDASKNRSEINFGRGIAHRMTGGSDGSFTNADLDNEMLKILSEYNDPNSYVLNPLTSEETMLLDTGFSSEVKTSIYKFIAIRQNNFFIASSEIDGEVMDNEKRIAIVSAMEAINSSVLESKYFNTPAFRGIIVSHSDSDNIPLATIKAQLLLDIAGGENREWNNNAIVRMTRSPLLIDGISGGILNEHTKKALHDLHAMYPEPMGGGQYKFTKHQTIYPEANSILDSTLPMLAMCDIQTQLVKTWVTFAGDQTTPPDALFAEIKVFLMDLINNTHYSSSFIIDAVVGRSDEDVKRGQRWAVEVTITTPEQMTIMRSSVTAKKLEAIASL